MPIEISRNYDSDQDRTQLRFDVTFSLDISPKGGKDPTFKLTYKPPTIPTAKNKPKQKSPPLSEDKDIYVLCNWVRAWREQPDAKKPEDVFMQYWQIWATQAVFTGMLELEVKWTAGSSGTDQTLVHDFSAGNALNATDTVSLATACPRVIKLINSPKVQVPTPPTITSGGDTAAIFRQKVAAVLTSICANLDGGLGPVWRLDPALPLVEGKPICEVDVAKLKLPGLLEEAWAQAITEYLVGTPYLAVAGDYLGLGATEDKQVFAKAIQSDPSVSIMYACQQLSTMSAITRGFDDAAKTPYDASDCKMIERKWKPSGVHHNPASSAGGASVAAGMASGAIRPGSVYVAENTRHIAFVLRTLTSNEVQLIDTGAMWPVPDAPADDPKIPSLRGNYDTHSITGIKAGRTLKEIGTLAPAPTLSAAVERTRRSRPLGLARLLVLSRTDLDNSLQPSATTYPNGTSDAIAHRLLFASPWLPMWNRASSQNYPITRLMWSLRNHPFASELEARWLIDVPQNDLFNDMAGSRNYSAGTQKRHMPVLDIGTTTGGYVQTLAVLTYDTAKCDKPTCPNYGIPDKELEGFHIWTDYVSKKSVQSGPIDRRPEHQADNTGLSYHRIGLGPKVTATLGAALGLDQAMVPAYLKDDGLK